MCGRYAFFNNIDSVKSSFDIDVIDSSIVDHHPSYNISPTQYAPIIFQDNTNRVLRNMRWGLIPSWSKDDRFASKLINARSETIHEKPSFKNLTSTNRCIVLANGYYEWVYADNKKQPYFIYSAKNTMISMAGLWIEWESIATFTIITKKSDESVSFLHHRMPLVIPNENVDSYLDNRNLLEDFIHIDDIKLNSHQVSTFVNSPRNNSVNCIDPIK